jgi:TolB-like protein
MNVLRKTPSSEQVGLMVLNFKNCTQEIFAGEYQPWEYGIASMVMTDIQSIGLFHIISREDLKKIIREQEFQYSGLVDEKNAVKIGRLVAATYILSGSFIVINGILRIEAKVFSVEKGTQLGAASIKGKTNHFFELEKQLVIKITKYLNVILNEREVAEIRRDIETKSVDASLNNYAGEMNVLKANEFKEKGEIEKANELLKKARKKFEQALKHDKKYKKARKNLLELVKGIPQTL